ncbi:MAG: glycosyltransferase family 4 protein [Saprospiraceae bacterium]
MKTSNNPILILYTELAEYTLACIEELSLQNTNIHVVRWPINSEAPFKFREINGVTFYERHDYSTQQLLELTKKLNPSLVLCSGWVDPAYIKCCKQLKKNCPTVLTLDNHWQGSALQRIKTLVAKYTLMSAFTHAWVPGKPQLPFVKKLGVPEPNIHTGFYSADLNLFQSPKRTKISKKFLFVGRYLEFKGIFELWQAFSQLKKQANTSWELHCVGHGDLWEERVQSEGIIHHGFLQPKELKTLVNECNVFVLPSHKEPWGVVVHEMAASGLALLCSDKIGASTTFLEEGKNGFIFKNQNTSDLQKALFKITELTDEQLLNMSHHSQELAQKISPKTWADTAKEIIGS